MGDRLGETGDRLGETGDRLGDRIGRRGECAAGVRVSLASTSDHDCLGIHFEGEMLPPLSKEDCGLLVFGGLVGRPANTRAAAREGDRESKGSAPLRTRFFGRAASIAATALAESDKEMKLMGNVLTDAIEVLKPPPNVLDPCGDRTSGVGKDGITFSTCVSELTAMGVLM